MNKQKKQEILQRLQKIKVWPARDNPGAGQATRQSAGR
jgi:hypothetical protein